MMHEIRFELLSPTQSEGIAPRLFGILEGNMEKIAPTGLGHEENYAVWFPAFTEQIRKESRKVVLIYDAAEIVGYFQYSIDGDTFFMEEIQITPSHQGKYGVFRTLYGFVLEQLPPNIRLVKAHANKNNKKSIAVLTRLGLSIVGENKSGRSYILTGAYADLVKWYNRKDIHA